MDTIKLKQLRHLVEKLEEQADDTDITFELILAALFPRAWDNIKEALHMEYIKGYQAATPTGEKRKGEPARSIKVTNVDVYNLEGALRGMRNPLESHHKCDSKYCDGLYVIGPNDMKLAQTLARTGSDHSKFMRQILVSMDITRSLYWWKEMDTYKVGTVANSESTMHKLAATKITLDSFTFDDELPEGDPWYRAREEIVQACEMLRLKYLETKDVRYWRALVQLLPNGWNQTRTWTGNYQVLKNIYQGRKNHKLVEWHDFCQMIENLPYGKELIVGEKE